MSSLKRLGKVRSLLEKMGGSIYSRKKLHKLVYLIQNSGENFGYDFVFHHYGVFSPLLARDLEFGCAISMINQDKDDALAGYKIALSEPASDFIASDNLENTSEDLVESLGQKDPQFLEVLSTIVYLNDNYYQGERLTRKLKELKPDLQKYYNEAYELAEEHYEITGLQ